jgi:hypothetical protein
MRRRALIAVPDWVQSGDGAVKDILMTRRLGAAIVAMTLMTAQTAFADDGAALPVQPLAPGQAAGLHQAQDGPPPNLVVIGAGILLVAAAVYLVAGTHYHTHGHSQSAAGGK